MAPTYQYAKLLWNGLKPETRRNYATAIRSYTTHCRMNDLRPWPATHLSLGTWVTTRAYGSTQTLMGQVSPSTLQSYLSAIRSVHIDLHLPTEVFTDGHIDRLLHGARNLFPPRPKRKRLPITRDILTAILSPEASRNEHPIDRLNLDAAFSLAFAGFLRLGEITYTLAHTKDMRRFQAERPTRRCVTLDSQNEALTLLLPRSKTDRNNDGIRLLVSRASDSACPIHHFLKLQEEDPQPDGAPLFRLHTGPFHRTQVIAALQRRLQAIGHSTQGFSGHSFRKGAAQHAYDNHLHDDQIQLLGRWTSEAFRRYYKTDPRRLFETHQQFLSGKTPSYKTK